MKMNDAIRSDRARTAPVNITDDANAMLKAVAAARGVTLGAVVAEAIEARFGKTLGDMLKHVTAPHEKAS